MSNGGVAMVLIHPGWGRTASSQSGHNKVSISGRVYWVGGEARRHGASMARMSDARLLLDL
ncbi:hypothetical protein L210DRAFT_3540238 [Boletus edulis BED1]|uniref:Uncharacterized protein n=1 Tax=Boletus edulis BED1 TaxID=1328754 RepID=A0AAD4BTE6_BOLED|nr:hypothetical protein L210DRAFT_3540238 [Boletus edulis BED1]